MDNPAQFDAPPEARIVALQDQRNAAMDQAAAWQAAALEERRQHAETQQNLATLLEDMAALQGSLAQAEGESTACVDVIGGSAEQVETIAELVVPEPSPNGSGPYVTEEAQP